MILFVSGVSRAKEKYRSPHLGWLLTPRNRNGVGMIVQSHLPWACDNDCLQHLDRRAYLHMLKRVATTDRTRLKFVTAPDVLGDARATLLRFRLWSPVLRYYELPMAFVAQDGQERLPVPWEHIRCLFIGGTTAWKESRHVRHLIRAAKARDMWVHVGRVTSERRENLFAALGVDSIDGTCYSTHPDKFIPKALQRLGRVQSQIDEAFDETENIASRRDLPVGGRVRQPTRGDLRTVIQQPNCPLFHWAGLDDTGSIA